MGPGQQYATIEAAFEAARDFDDEYAEQNDITITIHEGVYIPASTLAWTDHEHCKLTVQAYEDDEVIFSGARIPDGEALTYWENDWDGLLPPEDHLWVHEWPVEFGWGVLDYVNIWTDPTNGTREWISELIEDKPDTGPLLIRREMSCINGVRFTQVLAYNDLANGSNRFYVDNSTHEITIHFNGNPNVGCDQRAGSPSRRYTSLGLADPCFSDTTVQTPEASQAH